MRAAARRDLAVSRPLQLRGCGEVRDLDNPTAVILAVMITRAPPTDAQFACVPAGEQHGQCFWGLIDALYDMELALQ